VNRVDVVAQQSAGRASKPNPGWTDQYLCKVQKESYAENHDHDRDQTAGRAGESDVTEAGRRQRRNCEVESIGIVGKPGQERWDRVTRISRNRSTDLPDG